VNWKTTRQIADDFGVTPQTIRRWISNGEFEHVQRSRGGHFRVGVTPDVEQRFGYARVSSRKQRSSLDQQRIQIQEAYPEAEVIADIGSGFNFKRKGFVTLLERAMSGVAVHVVVSNADRLSRVGVEFVRLNQACNETDQFSTELLVGFGENQAYLSKCSR